jgi:hypothetical protein
MIFKLNKQRERSNAAAARASLAKPVTNGQTVKFVKTRQPRTTEYTITALSKSDMVPSCDGRVFRPG